MNEILQVRDIKKSYHTIHGEIEAIKNISFSLNEEEFIAKEAENHFVTYNQFSYHH
jgi:ABC-type microcin C transport system duplicated ATPase subunit YejF